MPPKKKDTRTEEQKIQDLLKEYTEIPKTQRKKIEPKDFVRYVADGQLKYGGVVIKIDDEYIVLKNFARNFSWSVDLKQPNLRLFKKIK